MTTQADDTPKNPHQEAADDLAARMDVDVLLYNGAIDAGPEDQLRAVCRTRRRRKNVLLVLVTWGGDGDSAYRIAKCLQTKYEKFTLFVSGQCKSAGTLIALGAHELVFGEDGELGPLDVQMSKKDSLWEMQSGLTANASLTALQDKARLAFQDFFLQIEAEIPGSITVRTAAEIATNLTVGLFAPLYSQIDPLHVGEAARAMQVADHYGRLLIRTGKNVEPKALNGLISNYPSHTFVIDREEAAKIFKNVRVPVEAEARLIAELGAVATRPLPFGRPAVQFLSQEPEAAPSPVERPVQAPLVEKDVSNEEKKHVRERSRSRPATDRAVTDTREGAVTGAS